MSKVLAGGPGSSSNTSFSEEVDKLRCSQSAVQRSEHITFMQSQLFLQVSSLFHGVSHCTINFAPKTINIGVGVGLGGDASTEEMDEFDSRHGLHTVLQEHLKCNSVYVCTPGFVTFGLILVVLLSIDLSGFCTLATLSLYS